jgi:hypothetical protein
MRTLLLMVTFLVSSASAYAQALAPAASSCFPLATKGEVVVTRTDGSRLKDTVLCMGRDQVVLATAGTVPLDSIRRIAKPRDGVADGVLKGAGAGLVLLALCAPHCGGAEPVIRVTAAYAILGGIIDAAQGNGTTIYRKGAGPSLAWRIRF